MPAALIDDCISAITKAKSSGDSWPRTVLMHVAADCGRVMLNNGPRSWAVAGWLPVQPLKPLKPLMICWACSSVGLSLFGLPWVNINANPTFDFDVSKRHDVCSGVAPSIAAANSLKSAWFIVDSVFDSVDPVVAAIVVDDVAPVTDAEVDVPTAALEALVDAVDVELEEQPTATLKPNANTATNQRFFTTLPVALVDGLDRTRPQR